MEDALVRLQEEIEDPLVEVEQQLLVQMLQLVIMVVMVEQEQQQKLQQVQ